MTESSPAPSHGPAARAPGDDTIRPWYRSRFFWAGIPGLLFLLWAWWDSGAYTTWFSAKGPGSGHSLDCEVSSGSVLVKWKPSVIPPAPDPWTFSGDRLRMAPWHFEVARAFDLEKEMDGLGKNPAAHGWVPSPGRSLPVAKLVRVEWQVAWWLLVLGYLLAGTLFIACWQHWKARRLERRGGPRAAISLRLWLPFVLLLGLTGCFFDSFQTRTRGWVGNGKYHVGWSHYRGLFTASFFHQPRAAKGIPLDAEVIREPLRDSGGLTSRRWPRWIGADFLGEDSRELRLPTTFTLGVYLVLWAGVACWRMLRQRARLRKLPPTPSPTP